MLINALAAGRIREVRMKFTCHCSTPASLLHSMAEYMSGRPGAGIWKDFRFRRIPVASVARGSCQLRSPTASSGPRQLGRHEPNVPPVLQGLGGDVGLPGN